MTAITDRTGWMDDAVCLQVGPEPFFEEVQGGADPVQAKALCRSCVSRTACLAWALEHQIREGVFGGFTDRPRQRIGRAHRAGKPLEDAIAEDDAKFYARQEQAQEIALAAAARKRGRARELARERAALRRAS